MAGQLLDSTYIFQNFWIDLLSIKLKVLFAKFNLLAVRTTISEEFSIVCSWVVKSFKILENFLQAKLLFM